MKSMRRSMVLFVLAAVIAAVLVALPASAAPERSLRRQGRREPARRRQRVRHDLDDAAARDRLRRRPRRRELRPRQRHDGARSRSARSAASRSRSRPATSSRLTAEDGVDYVTLDAEVVPTGGVTRAPLDGSQLVTTYPRRRRRGRTRGSWATTARVSASRSSTAARRSTPDFDNPKRLEQVRLKGQQDGSALNDPYGHGTFVAGDRRRATASTATTSGSRRTPTSRRSTSRGPTAFARATSSRRSSGCSRTTRASTSTSSTSR